MQPSNQPFTDFTTEERDCLSRMRHRATIELINNQKPIWPNVPALREEEMNSKIDTLRTQNLLTNRLIKEIESELSLVKTKIDNEMFTKLTNEIEKKLFARMESLEKDIAEML